MKVYSVGYKTCSWGDSKLMSVVARSVKHLVDQFTTRKLGGSGSEITAISIIIDDVKVAK